MKIKILIISYLTSFFSMLIITSYACYKIIINIAFNDESLLALYLLAIFLTYSSITGFLLNKTLKKLKVLDKKAMVYENVFVSFLLFFLVYYDYFTFSELNYILSLINNTENLIIFLDGIIFNVFILIALFYTIYANLNRKTLNFKKIDEDFLEGE